MKDQSPNDLRFYGKYAGTVVDTSDMTKSGKMQVRVPAVHGNADIWAMPCVPYADKGQGFFFLPPSGTFVWVEFEAGDRARPIWTGFAWGKGEAPGLSADNMVLSTPSGSIAFNAQKKGGEITLKTSMLTIEMRDGAVTITASGGATIEMNGGKTAINGAALEVM